MEPKSYENFIEKIIEKFEYETFSPENVSELSNNFKKIFDCDSHSPYWKKGDIQNLPDNVFYIEFKKFGNNRNKIFLKFLFIPDRSPRMLILSLADSELNEITDSKKELNLSNIWKDHSVLTKELKIFLGKGLELSEKHAEQ